MEGVVFMENQTSTSAVLHQLNHQRFPALGQNGPALAIVTMTVFLPNELELASQRKKGKLLSLELILRFDA